MVPRVRVMATQSRCRIANRDALNSIITKARLGDWFLLDLLSKNIDPLNFRDLVADYYKKLEGKGAEI